MMRDRLVAVVSWRGEVAHYVRASSEWERRDMWYGSLCRAGDVFYDQESVDWLVAACTAIPARSIVDLPPCRVCVRVAARDKLSVPGAASSGTVSAAVRGWLDGHGVASSDGGVSSVCSDPDGGVSRLLRALRGVVEELDARSDPDAAAAVCAVRARLAEGLFSFDSGS